MPGHNDQARIRYTGQPRVKGTINDTERVMRKKRPNGHVGAPKRRKSRFPPIKLDKQLLGHIEGGDLDSTGNPEQARLPSLANTIAVNGTASQTYLQDSDSSDEDDPSRVPPLVLERPEFSLRALQELDKLLGLNTSGDLSSEDESPLGDMYFEEAASLPSSVREGQACMEYHMTVAEQDVSRQAIALEKLGDIYQQRAIQAPLESSLYLRAAAMYSMALSRCNHDVHRQHIEEQILELEKLYLEFVVKLKRQQITTRASSAADTTAKAKTTLVYLRRNVSHRVEQAIKTWSSRGTPQEDKGQTRLLEVGMRKEIYAIRKLVRETMKSLWADIVYDVTWVLGPPPCKYSIVAVGELAIDEFTPYSDAKFVILLERNEKPNIAYFNRFATYLVMKIISLGETPMTSSGVKVIYDFYNKSLNSLFDANTTNGIKINSRNIEELWQKMEDSREQRDVSGLANRYGILVGLPRDIARVQMEATECGYSSIANDLLQVMFIEGEPEIYERYRQNLDIFLLSDTMRVHLTKGILNKWLPHFQLKPCFNLHDTNIQLERVFLELNALPALVQCLKYIHGLPGNTEWKIIEALRASKLLREEGEHDLKLALSLAYFLRVRVEMENCGQSGAKDILRQDPEKQAERFDIVRAIFKLSDDSILVRVYATLLPLVDYLRSFLLTGKKSSMMFLNLYDTEPWVIAHINYRILNYQQVINSMKIGINRISPEEQIEVYSKQGLIALHMRSGREANTYFTKVMDAKEIIMDPALKVFVFTRTWLYMGMVHFLEGRRKRALQNCLEALEMWKQQVGEGEKERLQSDLQALDFVISLHELLAVIYRRSGKELEALDHTQKAVASSGLVPNPQTSDDLRKARNLLDLSILNVERCEFKQAVINLRKANTIYNGIYGVHKPIFQVATCLRYLGEALDGLGKPTSGMCYKANAYIYTKYILGADLPKKPVFTFNARVALNVDAFTAIREAGFCRYAAKHYEEALRSFQTCTILSPLINQGKGSDWDLCVGLVFAGMCLEHTGKLQKSLENYQRVLEKFLEKQMYGPAAKNVFIAWCYSHIARACKKMNMIEEATNHFKTSLAMYRDIVADTFTQASIADDLFELAEIYEQQQEYDRAAKLLKECAAIRDQLFGQSHIHQKIATALQRLGLVESHMGDTKAAIIHLDRALDMYHRAYGEGTASLDLASVLYDLGIVYWEAQYRAKASRSLIKSLDMYKKLHGEHVPHEDTIKTITLLSTYQFANGDAKDAITSHKYWLKLCKLKFGKRHTEVGKVNGLLGADYMLAANWKEAAKAYENAIKIHRAEVGEEGDTIDVANWHRDLALVYKKLKKKEKSRHANEEHSTIRTRVLGRDAVDEDLLESIVRVAEAHEGRGEYQKCVYLRKKVLKKTKMLHGEEPHRETAACLDALIKVYLKLGEYDNALHYQNQYMSMLNFFHKGRLTVDMEISLKRSGDIYSGLGKYSQAVTQYEASLKMHDSLKQGAITYSPAIGAMSGLGNALVHMGEGEKAIEILQDAVRSARELKLQGPDREILAGALFSLAWACESYPNFPKALELHKEALELRKKIFDGDNLDYCLADSMRAVGRTACATGKFLEGMKMLTSALATLRRLYGEETVREDICRVTIELGQACAQADHAEEGVIHLTKALHMLRQLRGTEKPHFHIAQCLNTLAEVCKCAKKYEQAILFANQSLQMYRDILSAKHSDHPTVAEIITLIGDVYFETKQYKEAEKQYKHAAHIALVIHAGNDLSKDVERSMKKYKEAQSLASDIPVVGRKFQRS